MTHQYNLNGYVRLRPGGSKRSRSGQLTVPTSMMAHLTLGSLFKPEFTDEGILFRFAGNTDEDVVAAPSWVPAVPGEPQ